MNNTKAHQKIICEILIEFGKMPDVRVWPRFVGFDEVRKIRYGIKGEPDVQGIIGPEGRMLWIEVKTGTGKLSHEQEVFKKMAIKFGALYIEARSLEQALAEFRLFR